MKDRESSNKAWLLGRTGWRIGGTKPPVGVRKAKSRKRAKMARQSRKANR